MKQKVYIETSIPSYLTARKNKDIRTTANQETTIEWWKTRKQEFNLFVSELVIAEASRGHPEAAKRRMAALTDIPELEVTLAVKQLGDILIAEGALPVLAEMDAYHIAVATVHGIDYLLTWNCTHIANAVMRPRIESICRKYDYEAPIICTPQELMGDW